MPRWTITSLACTGKCLGIEVRVHPSMRTELALLHANQQSRAISRDSGHACPRKPKFHRCPCAVPKPCHREEMLAAVERDSRVRSPAPDVCESKGATISVSKSDETGRLREAYKPL